MAFALKATTAAAQLSSLQNVEVAKFSISNGSRVVAVAEHRNNFAEAAKLAGVALIASAVVATNANASTPARLSFDELQGQTYSELKGTGIANQCPIMNSGSNGFAFKAGDYKLEKFCMEPTSFKVKAESQFRGEGESFQSTKLMTRLTYTLDEMEGKVKVSPDGNITMDEYDGLDYAPVTVQLAGGERVPFLFSVKELKASGPASNISGPFLVPSYRGSSFLDPKGRGGSTGYDNAVALPAGGAGDEEELEKENTKNTAALEGKAVYRVARSDPETGEIAGVFESIQPSDTDLGSKAPKDVKIEGIWYAQLK